MPHADTEHQFVEQSAIVLFAELGRTAVSVLAEILGATGALLLLLLVRVELLPGWQIAKDAESMR